MFRVDLRWQELRRNYRCVHRDLLLVSSKTGGGMGVLRRHLASLVAPAPDTAGKAVTGEATQGPAAQPTRAAKRGAKQRSTTVAKQRTGSAPASSNWLSAEDDEVDMDLDEDVDHEEFVDLDEVVGTTARTPAPTNTSNTTATAPSKRGRGARAKTGAGAAKQRKAKVSEPPAPKTYRQPTAKAQEAASSRAVLQHKRLVRRVSKAGLEDLRKKAFARNPLHARKTSTK